MSSKTVETFICRNEVEFDVKVEFDFQPYEPPEWHHEAPGYPGCEANLEIEAVLKDGKDIFETLTEQEKEDLTQEAWESLAEG